MRGHSGISLLATGGCCTMESSHRSESGHLSLPPSATVPPTQNVEDRFAVSPLCLNRFAWCTWHPSQAILGVISNMNPYPSNHCHYWTVLVHLLAFWVSFLQVMQAKKGICFDMQMAASAHAALVTAWQAKGFLLWCHLFHRQHSRHALHDIFNPFCGAVLSSRMAVSEPRYPVLHGALCQALSVDKDGWLNTKSIKAASPSG